MPAVEGVSFATEVAESIFRSPFPYAEGEKVNESDPELKQYVVNKTMHMVATNYIVNMVLQGKINREQYDELIATCQDQNGINLVAFHVINSSVNSGHVFSSDLKLVSEENVTRLKNTDTTFMRTGKKPS